MNKFFSLLFSVLLFASALFAQTPVPTAPPAKPTHSGDDDVVKI